MKNTRILLLILGLISTRVSGTERFVALDGKSAPPFTSWQEAATNIQDAINASVTGDVVWVSNGIYSVGGKNMNRVFLDKALVVQSVGGADVTRIQGAWDPTSTNGALAVRCAALTNGAILRGFTLAGGASPFGYHQGGGGVWGSSTGGVVESCVITGNAGCDLGGGAYSVTLSNCTLSANLLLGYSVASGGGGAAGCNIYNCILIGNSTLKNNGGGALNCNLRNCAVVKNLAAGSGGGASYGTLLNCTLTGNRSGVGPYASGTLGGGVYAATLTNCIVYNNQCPHADPGSNYTSCTMTYCCSQPLALGLGDIDGDPGLSGDFHLRNDSRCRAAGLALSGNTVDIDGQSWASPPSIGCDEWFPGAVIDRQPQTSVSGSPLALQFTGLIVAGEQPFTFSWSKDGHPITDDVHYSGSASPTLLVGNFGPEDAGLYSVTVSNASGTSTSAPIPVVIHCVDLASGAPAAPFITWGTAATNIQEAIDSASDTEFVLVTNGIYNVGGKAIDSDYTNRVALTRRLTVASINGPNETFIEGNKDMVTTNGPAAVRCAWLTDGALLSGFTLTGGATRTNATPSGGFICGGGVWATSTNARCINCIISNNAAAALGGGVFQVTVERCRIVSNHAEQRGGGAEYSLLVSSLIQSNSAKEGGGVDFSSLINCTVVRNHADVFGGSFTSTAINSILYYNWDNFGPLSLSEDASFDPPSSARYSCLGLSIGGIGIGVITKDPELLDGFHLSSTSPCRSAGDPGYSVGTDIDGQPWNNPPAIGCDEFYDADCTGPLSVTASSQVPAIVQNGNLRLLGNVTGRPTRLEWSFGDGTSVTNSSLLTLFHSWSNPGDYEVTFTAFNLDNPQGVSTNCFVHVLPLLSPFIYGPVLSGTNYSFSFVTQPGASYVVEQTTNLAPPVVWQTVGYITGTGLPVQAIDRAATDVMRFYRVRSR